MKPGLNIYFDEQLRLCDTSTRAGQSEPFLVMEAPLAQVLQGSAEPAAVFGEAILASLRVLCPEAFASAGVADNRDDVPPESEIGHLLLRKSIAGKTSAYVDVIERMFREAGEKDADAATFYRESWPTLQAHLQTYPG